MKTETIEELKTYIEESGLEVSDIDLGDKEVCDIKTNQPDLAGFYIKYFNEFNKIFKKCEIKEVREILNDKEIFVCLIKLSAYKNRTSEIGKSYDIKRLTDYVNNNYDKIVDFFDLWREIVE